VIVAAEITSEANDKKQMLPMLEKVEGVVEKKPEKAEKLRLAGGLTVVKMRKEFQIIRRSSF